LPSLASHPERLWLPLVLAGVLAIYLPGLANLPVYDDQYLVEGALFSLYDGAALRERWLSYSSFVWVRDLFGEGWWKQRAVNVALHCATVVALWAFYREVLARIETRGEDAVPAGSLGASPALGLAVAVFALNPVAVYAVGYLIQRSILMATLFTLLALWMVARAAARSRPAWLAGALACYAAAVLSKEHAILAPLAAVPVYIAVARPDRRKLAILGSIGAAAILGAAALLSFRYGEILGKPFDEFSRVYLAQLARLDPAAPARAWPLSIMNQAWLFLEYGVRWFIPWSGWMSINLRPPFPTSFASFPQVLGLAGYLGVLAGGAWLLLRHRDWRALVGLSLLLPALLFATEFITVWVQDPFVLYRSYLWAIGIPGLVFVLAHGAPGKLLLGIGVAIASLFIWQGLDRTWSMATPERAWSDAIEKLSKDPRAVGRWFPYLNRGADYVDRDELKLAMRDFEMSAALGDMGMGTFNMGAVLALGGRHEQALAAFDLAQRQGYDLYNLPFQRGLSLAALRRNAEAYTQFQAAAKLDPPSPTRELLQLNLGKLALQLGKPAEARPPLEQLVAAEPRHREGRYLLAMARIGTNDPAAALPVLDALVAEDPKGSVHYARALAYHALERKPEALADIERALAADPGNAVLTQWQARIRAMP
jgi:tetratricopeptide (TPR) repeat protein